MFVKLSLVLGTLLAVTGLESPLPTVIPFCFESDCYIKPENNGKSWTDAQQMCKKYNSTLPIVDEPDRQGSVVAALYHFKLNGITDVWLGANASDYGSGNWRWLDGRQYSGTAAIQDAGVYNKSYVFLSKNATDIFAYATTPYSSYSYLCQYNTTTTDICTNSTGRLVIVKESRCYVKYDEKLSWFNARYNCLTNNGELASFSNVSLLSGILDTGGSWVGLRRSQWNWQNAVTGLSSDVTFTSWSSNQPNDANPSCISIDYTDYPNWKDWNCSQVSQYICQVLNATVSTQVTLSGELSTPSSTTGSVPTEMPGSADSEYQNKVNVPLAIGLGVGLGAGLITAIIIALTVIIVRKKHRNRDSNENSKSKEKFESQNGRISPDEEATEMDEVSIKPPLDEASPNYATVQEANDLKPNSQYADDTIQSQLDDTLPNYGIVKKGRDIDPISHHTASSISQSQLDDASPNYATVQEACDLEPNSQHADDTRQSQLDDTFPNYGIVQKARDIDPISHHTDSIISQSQLDEASPNYATVQETTDLEPNSQHADDTSQSQLEDTLTNYATVQKVSDLEPVAQDTDTTSYHASANFPMVQDANDLEQHTANTNESQFDDISPTYAAVQGAEGLTQDSELSVNQNPVYADLDFCREAF